MKIRNGFISNSSSSSFIIGVKGKLTSEKLLKLFKIPKDSPFYNFSKDIAECIINNSKARSVKELMNDYCCTKDDLPEDIKKIIDNNMTLYTGYASDDGEYIEKTLCDMNINYEDDDLIIIKDGSY